MDSVGVCFVLVGCLFSTVSSDSSKDESDSCDRDEVFTEWVVEDDVDDDEEDDDMDDWDVSV